jgi:hypothetical protein
MKKIILILFFAFLSITIVNSAKAQIIIDQGYCGGNLTWTLLSDSTLTISGNGEMYDFYPYDSPWFKHLIKITTLVINNGVGSIGQCAFYGCTKLSSVTIGNSVIIIENRAFEYCTDLKHVTIPDSVIYIGSRLFAFCTGLASVIIGTGLTSISRYAFSTCEKLNTIECKATTPISIEMGAFDNTPKNAKVIIPCHTTQAYKNSDWGKKFTNFEEDCDGVNELQNEKLKIYPNPVSGSFLVECEFPVSIKLYDLIGKEILCRNINDKTEVNISSLSKGVYTISVFFDNKPIGNRKIMKQ